VNVPFDTAEYLFSTICGSASPRPREKESHRGSDQQSLQRIAPDKSFHVCDYTLHSSVSEILGRSFDTVNNSSHRSSGVVLGSSQGLLYRLCRRVDGLIDRPSQFFGPFCYPRTRLSPSPAVRFHVMFPFRSHLNLLFDSILSTRFREGSSHGFVRSTTRNSPSDSELYI